MTLRKTQHNTVFADSESVFYTCVFGLALAAHAAPAPYAYQRCWYVSVNTVPAAGRRLVFVPLRINWLYSG